MLSDQIFELNWAHSVAQGNAYANPQSFSGHQSAYRSCFFSHTKNLSWYFDVLGRSLSCFVSFIDVFILEYLITSHIYLKLNLSLWCTPSKTFGCITLHYLKLLKSRCFGWRFSQRRDSRSQSARKIAGRLVKIFCKLWPKSCINGPFESLQKSLMEMLAALCGGWKSS